MVDDFHGTNEWEVFMDGLKQIFPDRPVVDIEDDNPIFHILYDLHAACAGSGPPVCLLGPNLRKGRCRAALARRLRR